MASGFGSTLLSRIAGIASAGALVACGTGVDLEPSAEVVSSPPSETSLKDAGAPHADGSSASTGSEAGATETETSANTSTQPGVAPTPSLTPKPIAPSEAMDDGAPVDAGSPAAPGPNSTQTVCGADNCVITCLGDPNCTLMFDGGLVEFPSAGGASNHVGGASNIGPAVAGASNMGPGGVPNGSGGAPPEPGPCPQSYLIEQQRLELQRDLDTFAVLALEDHLKAYLPNELFASPGRPESNLDWLEIFQSLGTSYELNIVFDWGSAPSGERDSIRVTISRQSDLCPVIDVPLDLLFEAAAP